MNGKFLNGFLAGAAGAGALWAGSALTDNNKIEQNISQNADPVKTVQIAQPQTQQLPKSKIQKSENPLPPASWVQTTAVPFIIKWERKSFRRRWYACFI